MSQKARVKLAWLEDEEESLERMFATGDAHPGESELVLG